uniref:T-cell activation-related wd repeat protein, putative n=1 Tax=Theileria annulata TaxID=5874 RepID=A0A3B0MEU8_THEAN
MFNVNDSVERRSSIFKPGGQIGLICDGNSFCLNHLGTSSFILVSALSQFVVYDSLSLRVVFISLPLKSNIKSIASEYENVYLVLKDNSVEITHEHNSEIIGVFHHQNQLVTYTASELITYTKAASDDDNSVPKWSLEKVITMDSNSEITAVLPLLGMNNKVLVGFSDSSLILLNLKSGKTLYKFSKHQCINNNKLEDVKSNSSDLEGVAVMAQSCNTSSGAVAIGYNSGYVSIFDVNKDEFLGGFSLTKKQKQPKSMSFVLDYLGISSKSDSLTRPELLVVGTTSGDLVVFDLLKFTLISCIESAHTTPIISLMHIEADKCLISLGENSMITWTMDSDKTFLRELRSRKGFIGTINILTPYDEEEHDLLVCTSNEGSGSLGKISTIQQHQCVTFSTKSSKAKLKKITGISSCYQRHYDWPNIVTCHQNSHQVHVWSGFKKILTEKVLKVPEMNSIATSVCLTKCGNYAIVGYQNGQIHLFTLQSCNYDSEFTRGNENESLPAHSSQVINISLVGNSKIISISNSKTDRMVRVWDVIKVKLELEYEPELPKGVGAYNSAVGNFLTALACTDDNIYVLDVKGNVIIRKITYHSKVNSMKFHMNDSWLIMTTERGTMLVYDILSACYVDYVEFLGNILDFHMDSSGSFMLVSNERAPGVVLQYANKHAFELFPKSILYKDIPKQPIPVDIPPSKIDSDQMVESEDENKTEEIEFKSTKSQLEAGLITLSGLTSSKLQTMLFLDEIKERSKPKEPPKTNDNLPFFLPTTYKDGQLVFVEPEPEEIETPKPRESLLKSTDSQTQFELLLYSNHEDKFEMMMEYLLAQTPAMVHISLGLFSESKMDKTLCEMLRFFQYQVKSRRNADALQVFLHLFLKFHAERLSNLKNPEAKKIMCELKTDLKGDYKLLQESFDKISCYIKFLTHLQLD